MKLFRYYKYKLVWWKHYLLYRFVGIKSKRFAFHTAKEIEVFEELSRRVAECLDESLIRMLGGI